MLRFLLHIALLFLLVSCGDSIGPEAHTKPVELYELGLDNRAPVGYVLAENDFTVRRFYYYAVNEKLKAVGDTVFAKPAKDLVSFEFPARNIESETVMFVAELQADDSVTVKLQSLTEVGRKNEFILSTASTLLTPRVMELMRQGYPVYTAKNMALQELQRQLNVREELFDIEDVDVPYENYDTRCVNCDVRTICTRSNFVVYAWSFVRQNNSASGYRDFLDSVKADFAEDGILNEEHVVVPIVDYGLMNLTLISRDMDSLVSSMKLIWDTKYSRNGSGHSDSWYHRDYCGSMRQFAGDWQSKMLNHFLGFGKCNRDNLFEVLDNPFESGASQDEKFICDIRSANGHYGSNVCDTSFAWRPFTQKEKDLGLCIGDTALVREIYAFKDSVKYKCAPDGNWYKVISYDELRKKFECRTTEIYYVEDIEEYRSRAYIDRNANFQKFDVIDGECNGIKLRARWDEVDSQVHGGRCH